MLRECFSRTGQLRTQLVCKQKITNPIVRTDLLTSWSLNWRVFQKGSIAIRPEITLTSWVSCLFEIVAEIPDDFDSSSVGDSTDSVAEPFVLLARALHSADRSPEELPGTARELNR